MNDRTLPVTEKLYAPEELNSIRKYILHEMWRAEQSEIRSQPRMLRKCLFYAPKLGRYLYNDEFTHPQVAEALIDHDLTFEGFMQHQGENMVCYRLTDRYMLHSSGFKYDDWYGSKI